MFGAVFICVTFQVCWGDAGPCAGRRVTPCVAPGATLVNTDRTHHLRSMMTNTDKSRQKRKRDRQRIERIRALLLDLLQSRTHDEALALVRAAIEELRL